jgi:predicted MFS family arabinose efflux permease
MMPLLRKPTDPPGSGSEGPSLDGAPAKPGIPPRRHPWRAGTFRSLRHRNYRLYFFGQIISLTGSWVQTTALMWLAFDLTHESKWPAMVAAAQIFPTFLFGAWGGVLADRWPKRSLIFLTQAAFMAVALGLAGLVLLGVVVPWHLLVIAAAGGLINALDLPARLAFVVDMVGREDLLNAVALNSSLFNRARALGPAVGGLLLAWLGPGACFLVNGLSYVAVLVALARMDTEGSVGAADGRSGLRSFLGGFGYLARKPGLAVLFVLVGMMTMFGWPFLALLPGLAQHTLGVQERGYSLLLSGTGLGALLAALVVATFGSLSRRRQFIAAGVGLTTAALLGLSATTNLAVAVACCGLIGFGLILFLATSQAVVQLGAADHNRGRVMGIWSMTLSGAVPLGNLLFGPAADRWGEAEVIRLEGLACGSAVLVLFVLLRLWSREGVSAGGIGSPRLPDVGQGADLSGGPGRSATCPTCGDDRP